METIQVKLGERSYPIHIGSGLLDCAGEYLRAALGKTEIAVITDDHVAPLYLRRVLEAAQGAGLRAEFLTLSHGERTKCPEILQQVWSFLAQRGITRTGAVVALGGGVIGDLAGFAAASWLRGIRFVQIPTTLLAQVDSSVGGKVAVDLPEGKNLVGAFWQPSLVLCDPDALETLTPDFWRDGLGEVVKYGCICDAELFQLLEAQAGGGRSALMARMDEILRRCIGAKAEVVARDERDTGLRMTLNFGHTLAHAVETCQHYEGLRHGEAVAVGMDAVTRISEDRGWTEAGTYQRLHSLLVAMGLPTEVPDLPEEDLLTAMGRDKKNLDGALRLVTLNRIGEACIRIGSPALFKGCTGSH